MEGYSMFFREKTPPSGRVLQLMVSYRNAQHSPRQRLVVSLGDARIPLSLRSLVARAVHDHINGRVDLFSSTEITGETRCRTDYVVRRIAARPPSSGQRFACSFLQIPSRGEHPCRPANTSPCRACKGLPGNLPVTFKQVRPAGRTKKNAFDPIESKALN